MLGKFEFKVSGKVIPLTFSLFALRSTCKELGIGLDGILVKMSNIQDNKEDIFEALDFIACIFANAANVNLERGAVTYDIKDGYNWIEEIGIGSDTIKDAMKALGESISSVIKSDVPTTVSDDKKNVKP